MAFIKNDQCCNLLEQKYENALEVHWEYTAVNHKHFSETTVIYLPVKNTSFTHLSYFQVDSRSKTEISFRKQNSSQRKQL